jgi:hypothetical protein
MATYTQPAGGTKLVLLDVPLRAWWSQPRAWHGEDLVLHVETAYLPDNTPFAVRIYEANVSPFDEDAYVDEKDGGQLVGNRAAVPYSLKWDKATLGRPLALQTDQFQFFFEVRIDKPQVRGRANLLYVHLHPYVVSG